MSVSLGKNPRLNSHDLWCSHSLTVAKRPRDTNWSGLVSISSDRSGTYPTRKQLSSDLLRLYFFVTHAITFEKPMRMKKHVQKKIISVLTESFSKEATLACLLCSIVKYITLTRSRICSYFASCHCLRILFFFS